MRNSELIHVDDSVVSRSGMTSTNNYKQARQEIETGNVNEDIWLHAVAQSRGNNEKAISFYLSARGEQLYRENTSFFKRTTDSTKLVLDLRSRRGKVLCSAIFVGVLLLMLFVVQPVLRANASKEYQRLYDKAKAAAIIGNTPNYMFKTLGQPNESKTTESSLIYIYNSSSSLCIGGSRYDLNVYVDTQTARIVGFGGIE